LKEYPSIGYLGVGANPVGGKTMATPYVGKRIQELRGRKKISQKSLMELTRLRQSYLANVETGRIKLPLLANLRKIADALGVSIEALVEGTTSEQLLTAPRPADRAYCPNPVCPGATEGKLHRQEVVVHFSISRFDEDDEERQFCPHCRSVLVAVCPKKGCGASILSDVAQYGFRCGEPLYAAWEKETKKKEEKQEGEEK